jgi:hypothetical protein
MQSEIHFNRDQPALATIRRWLSPTGGTFVDGVRLAVANGLFLVAALILSFVLAVLRWLLHFFMPVPSASPGLIVLALSVLFGIVVWYRYAVSHRKLAQASGRSTRPDRFGLIAGSPFVLLALLLLASGTFGLFVSIAGLNVGGAGAAAGRLIFALLFGLLAVASVVVAKVAMRD